MIELLAAVLVVLAIWLAERILRRRCRHMAATRHWFKGHRYIRSCNLCGRILERGKDLGHRYPDGAPGVRRAAKKVA